jgi:poly(3-hydroxybutyrate) depolymerase
MTTHLATRSSAVVAVAVLATACAGSEIPTEATGGSSPGTGGASGGTTSPSGGTSYGGTSTGGKATGGTSTGGKATGGTSTATGGSSGSSTNPPNPSEGCGKAPADPCDTQSAPCTLTINGTQRTFYVQLPDNYDQNHPYPVVFQYHPLGGTGWGGLTMYRIRPNFPAAIYVSPDGTGSGNLGFPNTNGMDEALTRAMMADLEGKYCVDKARYYATGFSYGGSMSYTAACNMSDVFRAIGAAAGAPISGAACSRTPPANRVAFWGTHGTEDTALPIDMAYPIRDAFVTKNGCTTTTQPVDPSPCVAYQGCAEGYPVVWCERQGDGHAIPSFFATAVANFFKQF